MSLELVGRRFFTPKKGDLKFVIEFFSVNITSQNKYRRF